MIKEIKIGFFKKIFDATAGTYQCHVALKEKNTQNKKRNDASEWRMFRLRDKFGRAFRRSCCSSPIDNNDKKKTRNFKLFSSFFFCPL